MSNPFWHTELHTANLQKARSFYAQLFNWKLEDMPMGEMTYTMIQTGDGPGGGIMQNPVADAPSHWLSYVQVADLDAATQKAKALGASIMNDGTEVPGMGRFSIISDPTGAVIGLWQPKH